MNATRLLPQFARRGCPRCYNVGARVDHPGLKLAGSVPTMIPVVVRSVGEPFAQLVYSCGVCSYELPMGWIPLEAMLMDDPGFADELSEVVRSIVARGDASGRDELSLEARDLLDAVQGDRWRLAELAAYYRRSADVARRKRDVVVVS